MSEDFYRQAIAREGFCCLPNGLDPSWVTALQQALRSLEPDPNTPIRSLRHLFSKLPILHELCREPFLRRWVESILGASAFPARAIFLDKTPQANWATDWHQDLTIAVRQRRESPGFQAWSLKEGVRHVQPPARVLEQMLTLRLHLDDTDRDRGCLWVVPGSHRFGILSSQEVRGNKEQAIALPVPRGGILAMKPLLVHASRRVTTPSRRRVIHIEFAAAKLPDGLRWRCS